MSEKISDFHSFHLTPRLLETLDRLDFTKPTPIQLKAIPKAIKGRDIIGLAQTGTGKTLAFALPMIQKIKNKGGRGLILVPTRELALQAAEAMQPFLEAAELYAVVLIGGASGSEQYRQLKENPEIVIATPGRLYEHLCQKNLDLDDAETFVLDEADRMFDMGFLPQVEKIMRFLPPVRQTMMFSATMPQEIEALAQEYMTNPIRIEVSPQGTAPELVNQELYIVERGKKTELLGKLLDTYWGSVLLFVRTRYNAKKITRLISSFPHSVAELHSNRTMNQRKEALEGFKSGKYRILVATDIAARGIDVMGIELVINYDLPDETENYVHRIGRTGRAGHPGHSITLAAPDQEFEIREIEKLVRKKLIVIDLPGYTAEKFVKGTEARPKGEKRLPRKEMAGSENDPVKKPRNIFAARRKAAAARKAKEAAEKALKESANEPEEIFSGEESYSEQYKPISEGSELWEDSEIKEAIGKNSKKPVKKRKVSKKAEKKQDVQKPVKKEKDKQKRGKKEKTTESRRYEDYRPYSKRTRQERTQPPAPQYDKDYKPPRPSLIMDSAYFDDDRPATRYYDKRRKSYSSPSWNGRNASRKHEGNYGRNRFRDERYGKGENRNFKGRNSRGHRPTGRRNMKRRFGKR